MRAFTELLMKRRLAVTCCEVPKGKDESLQYFNFTPHVGGDGTSISKNSCVVFGLTIADADAKLEAFKGHECTPFLPLFLGYGNESDIVHAWPWIMQRLSSLLNRGFRVGNGTFKWSGMGRNTADNSFLQKLEEYTNKNCRCATCRLPAYVWNQVACKYTYPSFVSSSGSNRWARCSDSARR